MVEFTDVLRVPCTIRAKTRLILPHAAGLLAVFGAATSAFAAPKYAGMVIDANTGKTLYAHKADEARYPASLTKMMTLYMLFSEIKKGKLSFSSKLTVSKNAASKPPSKLGLKPDQQITVINAIRALVTKSANDVAVTVAENLSDTEEAFARAMTRKAYAMGMKKTVFKNASGLPNSKQLTTARDMITLSVRLNEDFPEYFHFFKTKRFIYKGRRYGNHNRLLYGMRGIEGIKTGYTRASGFNLTTSYRKGNKHLIAVVMGRRSSKKRNATMRSILNRSLKKAVAMKRKIWKKTPIKPSKVIRVAANERDARTPPKVRMVKTTTIGFGVQSNPVKKTKSIADRLPSAGGQPIIHRTGSVSRVVKVARLNPVIQRSSPQVKIARPVETVEKIVTTIETKETARLKSDEPAEKPKEALGPYHIQVGAFTDMDNARMRLVKVSTRAKDILKGHPPLTVRHSSENKDIIRARFASFTTRRQAKSACRSLKRRSIACIVQRAE